MIFPQHLKERFDKVKDRGDVQAVANLLGYDRATASTILNGRRETTSLVVEKIKAFIVKKEAKVKRLSTPLESE